MSAIESKVSEKTQASKMLTLTKTLSTKALTNEACSYLDNKSLSELFKTCKHFSSFSKGDSNTLPTITPRRVQRATELLSCVLNISEANRKRILELISSESKVELESIILMRVTATEFFYGTTMPKEVRSNESPLEAAARNGDNPIAEIMLNALPRKQRDQGIIQLKAVRAALLIPSEPGSYIPKLVEFRIACQKFNNNIDTLIKEYKRDEIDIRSGMLGDTQQNLSWFLLQVFCHPRFHDPIPKDFTLEPNRNCQVYTYINGKWILGALDIMSLGKVTNFALYKGGAAGGFEGFAGMYAGRDGVWGRVRFDSAAIDSLYEVLPADLDRIINSPAPALEPPRAPSGKP